MSASTTVIPACFVWFLTACHASSDIKVVFFCEPGQLSRVCGEIAGSMLPYQLTEGDAPVHITAVLVEPADSFIENVKLLQDTVIEDQSVNVIVGFGVDAMMNAVATVAKEANITALVYTTSHHRKIIYEEHVITLHPDHAGLARAIDTVIGRKMLLKSYVICEESLVTDGFLDVLEDLGINISFRVSVSKAENDSSLRLKLLHIHDIGVRVMVVHVSPGLFQRIAAVATDLSYFDTGYAWIVTEEALEPGRPPGGASVPTGILAVEGDEFTKYEEILISVVKAITEEIEKLYTTRDVYEIADSDVKERFGTTILNPHPDQRDLTRGIKTNPGLFGENGSRKGVQYTLLNYVKDPHVGTSHWKMVGYVVDSDLELETVVWPGQSIFGPVSLAREFYTVVTRPAEPFIYIRGPVASREDCPVNNICLKIFSQETFGIKASVESFRNKKADSDANYTIYCCEGIVIDILHSLSVELRFDFLLYFKGDDQYGHSINGSWTGMIGDVYHGAADILAGAISITSERTSAVWFTESFYYSSFNMVASRERPSTHLWAFTRPFDFEIWILIIISATIVAIATALYEWNSPFGLNPWGKKRKRNYTLGSAINMVFSLWFGHTVRTKSPKSWPSKVLQNFWAATAIFITAGYTANLAANLAGNAYNDSAYSILDSQITSKRVGVVATSAVEEYTKALNSGLHTRFSQYHVDDIQSGISKIRSGELDLYMDDTPLLEYALTKYDTNCTLKYAAHPFGDNSYAFAMKKGSWLKAKFDPLILNYVELGFVDDLKWRYMGKARQCENKLMSKDELQFGLSHTGGLFVMLLIGCGLAMTLLLVEYVTYYLVLPVLRKKPVHSVWRRRNFEFFSQRLYRAINSEKVKAPAHALVSKVRQKKYQLRTQIQGRLNQSQSVPSALRSYQFTKQALQTFNNVTFHDFGKSGNFTARNDSSDSIYTISGNNISDVVEGEHSTDRSNRVNFHHSISSPLLCNERNSNKQGFINPIFESDEEDSDGVSLNYRANTPPLIDRTRDTVVVIHERDTNTQPTNSALKSSNINANSECGLCKTKDKRYVTWPSPKTRKKSVKRCQNNKIRAVSHSGNKTQTDNNKRIVNEITKKTCRTCSSSSLDSHHGNHGIELKDNRLKSTLRNHAMGTMPRSPSVSLDDGAVEVLSKEDLLVLWKKSEIELQTKLNKMLHQNNHLRQLVNIAEENMKENRRESQAVGEEPIGAQPVFKCSRL